MQGTLLPIDLPPGLYHNGTQYQALGRWYTGNRVRFFARTIRPIGGWRRVEGSTGADLPALTGIPRGAVAWRSSTGVLQIGVGTHSKLYVITGGTAHDITPAGFVVGLPDSIVTGWGGAYGNGEYGAGPYGMGSQARLLDEADTWQLDTFGDWLVGVSTSDGRLLVWQGNVLVPAAPASNAPTNNRGVVVTPERFLVALGAGGNGRKVQWASQETTDTWTPSAANTAGDWLLETRGRIQSGVRTKTETLIWTDADLHRMVYLGGTLVYRLEQVADNCGLLAPNAKVVVDSQAFWMGQAAFYRYDGYVHQIPCDVRDFVFGDFNQSQAAKVWATAVSQYGEIWWFYPSAGSVEIDRYVCYNWLERHWSFGELARTAGFDAGATPLPWWFGSDGAVYEHETGTDRTDGPAPYLESGPVQLGQGDRLLNLHGLVPDERTLGDVELTMYLAAFPMGTETVHGPFALSALTPLRLTARQARFRLSETMPTDWRVGTFRLAVTPGSRR